MGADHNIVDRGNTTKRKTSNKNDTDDYSMNFFDNFYNPPTKNEDNNAAQETNYEIFMNNSSFAFTPKDDSDQHQKATEITKKEKINGSQNMSFASQPPESSKDSPILSGDKIMNRPDNNVDKSKKKKKTTLLSQLNKGPAPISFGGEVMYDLDQSCGVVFTSGIKLGMRCTHPLLSCKLHTTDQKKKVTGRSLPYEQLVKLLIAERKAAVAAGAGLAMMKLKSNNGTLNRFAPKRIPKPLDGADESKNGGIIDSYYYNNIRNRQMFFRRRLEISGVFKSMLTGPTPSLLSKTTTK